jgi:hypothetical protein
MNNKEFQAVGYGAVRGLYLLYRQIQDCFKHLPLPGSALQ